MERDKEREGARERQRWREKEGVIERRRWRDRNGERGRVRERDREWEIEMERERARERKLLWLVSCPVDCLEPLQSKPREPDETRRDKTLKAREPSRRSCCRGRALH